MSLLQFYIVDVYLKCMFNYYYHYYYIMGIIFGNYMLS